MAISKTAVEKAIALIKKGPANADYFFEQLRSPAWIEPLAKEKLFANPYSAERRGDSISFPIWTPGQYLARMAMMAEAQTLVLSILKALPKCDNPRVYEVVADAARALPPTLSRQLVPQLLSGLELPLQLLLPGKVGDVLIQLADARQTDDSLQLARSLFFIEPSNPPPAEPDKDTSWILRRARARFHTWEYGELLKRCVSPFLRAAEMAGFALLCDLLDVAVAEARHEPEQKTEDYSYVWRPSIERSEDHADDIRDALVSAVRDAAAQLAQLSDEKLAGVLQHLRGRRRRVFHRIALYIATLHAKALGAGVSEWLDDPLVWGDIGLQLEFDALLSASFGLLPVEAQQRYLDWVDQGPDTEGYRTFRRSLEGKDPSAEDLVQFREVWIRNRLAPIEAHLPPRYSERLRGLVSAFGPPLDARRGVRVSSGWMRERSPLSEEEAIAADWTVLIGIMRNWSPPADFDGPSEEGFAGSVRERVGANSSDAISHLHAVTGVKPQYLAAIIEGLRQTVREKQEIEWGQVLAFLDRVTCDAQAATVDVDAWSWVSKCAASLMNESFEGAASIPVRFRGEAWTILERLTESPDPTPHYEARFGSDGFDPASLSLNTVRGDALHGVIKYALWWRRHLQGLPEPTPELKNGFAELPEVRAVLERHLDPSVDPSLAVRSVYGQWFPWLVALDLNWALSEVSRIFPLSPENVDLFWSAWGTYVVFCDPYSNVLAPLRAVYRAAIDAQSGPGARRVALSEKPSEHLAQHLMAYYWRGELSLADNDLVDVFFKAFDEKVRGYALDWVGQVMTRSDGSVSPEASQRLRTLWEWRTTAGMSNSELQAFGWWFTSRKLDEDWCFEILQHVLDKSVLPEPDHLVAQTLALLSGGRTTEAVTCLDGMVGLASAGWSIHGWLDSARTVLQAGLGSANRETRERARRIVHRLGALRFRDFRQLLKTATKTQEMSDVTGHADGTTGV